MERVAVKIPAPMSIVYVLPVGRHQPDDMWEAVVLGYTKFGELLVRALAYPNGTVQTVSAANVFVEADES